MPNATMGTMATMYSKEYTETNTRVYVHKDSEAQIVFQTQVCIVYTFMLYQIVGNVDFSIEIFVKGFRKLMTDGIALNPRVS